MANPKPVGKSTPIIGGVLTFALFGIHRLFVGQIYSRSEAVSLVEALSDSSLYFGSAIASASATILAPTRTRPAAPCLRPQVAQSKREKFRELACREVSHSRRMCVCTGFQIRKWSFDLNVQ